MTSSHFFSGHLDPTPSFLIFTVFAGAKTVATLVQWRNVTFVMVKTWLHNRGWEWSISMWFEGHFSMDGWLVVVCSWWCLVLSEWKTMIDMPKTGKNSPISTSTSKWPLTSMNWLKMYSIYNTLPKTNTSCPWKMMGLDFREGIYFRYSRKSWIAWPWIPQNLCRFFQGQVWPIGNFSITPNTLFSKISFWTNWIHFQSWILAAFWEVFWLIHSCFKFKKATDCRVVWYCSLLCFKRKINGFIRGENYKTKQVHFGLEIWKSHEQIYQVVKW